MSPPIRSGRWNKWSYKRILETVVSWPIEGIRIETGFWLKPSIYRRFPEVTGQMHLIEPSECFRKHSTVIEKNWGQNGISVCNRSLLGCQRSQRKCTHIRMPILIYINTNEVFRVTSFSYYIAKNASRLFRQNAKKYRFRNRLEYKVHICKLEGKRATFTVEWY